MSEIIENTQEAEVVQASPAEETAENAVTEEVNQAEVEQTIGDMVDDDSPEEKANMIPESVFLGEKKARKEAEKEVRRLKRLIEDGGSSEEISDSIAEIAEEHDVDKQFLNKLAKTIKADAERELEAKFNSKFESTNKQNKFEEAFQRAYQTAMDRAPEFASIANMDVIKSLATLPQNAKKTLSQILEETYGNAITGKRTIETTSPGGGKDPEPLDYDRAQRDPEYFKQVMADPKKKAQYNSRLFEKGF